MYCFDEFSIKVFKTALFGLFSPELPSLIYYSHVPAIAVSVLLSIFVLSKARSILSARILLGVFFVFGLWTFIDLLTWTQVNISLIMFLWSFWFALFVGIFVLSLYFVYTFSYEQDLSLSKKVLLFLPLFPILLLNPTSLNLSGFDLASCNALENPIALTYSYSIAFLYFITIIIVSVRAYRNSELSQKKKNLYASLGVLLFLLSFSLSTLVASILNLFNSQADTFLVDQYGYFGMTVFVAFLAYIVVKFRAFEVQLVAIQALAWGMIVLISSMFFFAQTSGNKILIFINLVLASVGGYFMVRSVKKEVKQREQLEELTQKLEVANDHLKVLDKMKSEFVSVASHQLRSPITAIRGYVSMLLEGSYGKFPEKAQEVLERIGESSKFMASSIEDYLNVSRIEAGNMKYELSDFNLKEQAEKVADELRQTALKKGLVLVFRSDVSGSGMVHADIGKTRQVISNFIDNAIKYTEQGTITVVAHDDPNKKKMWVTISDSGIGMSKETLSEVFDKFVRAKNANQINVTGTGLGLYVAKKMAHGMGGKVWAESEGEGKGSQFHIEFPELPGVSKVV